MEDIKTKKIFNQRIDIYGQALAIYVFVLLIFLVFYGTLKEGEFIILFNPLLIIMVGIILIGAAMLLTAIIKRKQIIIENDKIEIRNRFKSLVFSIDEIQRLKINRSPAKVVNENAYFIKIKLKRKKKSILVRVASFNDYKELVVCFDDIMKRFLELRK